MLLARIYQAFPLTCPQCGTEMRIVPFLTEASTVQCITPPRGPPLWGEEDSGTLFLDEKPFTGDALAQPQPEYEFDKCMTG
jgi:hypothetical protein